MTTNSALNGTVTKPSRRDRFASGAAVKLPLSDGDWVLVHAELTYGQQRRLATAGISGMPAALAEQGQGQRLTVDYAAFEIERLVTWVMDWSFVDADGQPVHLSREAIEALEPDTAAELHQALDRHIEGLEAKKAPPSSTTNSRATSSSASASAGRGRT
jgi:hypothetical protein